MSESLRCACPPGEIPGGLFDRGPTSVRIIILRDGIPRCSLCGTELPPDVVPRETVRCTCADLGMDIVTVGHYSWCAIYTGVTG